jgi:glutamate/tyrosine decarboxylase-like PLP-dependent enzyme
MWVHIDGCFGGHMLFVEEIRNRNHLASKCDSFSWDAHKILTIPQQTSMCITAHPEILETTNAVESGFFDRNEFEFSIPENN